MSRKRFSLLLALCCASLCISASEALGTDDHKRETAQTTGSRKDKQPTEKELAEQQKVLAFVGEHQPKLLELMQFLRAKQPEQYAQAMRDTQRSMQRLENLSRREPVLYQAELNLWRIRSEIRLLAARMSVAKAPPTEAQTSRLEKLLKQQLEEEIVRLKAHRERTARQLAQYDEQIRQKESNQEDLFAKLMKHWQARIEKQPSRKNKSTTKPKSEKTNPK